jgi:hypothetical protein
MRTTWDEKYQVMGNKECKENAGEMNCLVEQRRLPGEGNIQVSKTNERKSI